VLTPPLFRRQPCLAARPTRSLRRHLPDHPPHLPPWLQWLHLRGKHAQSRCYGTSSDLLLPIHRDPTRQTLHGSQNLPGSNPRVHGRNRHHLLVLYPPDDLRHGHQPFEMTLNLVSGFRSAPGFHLGAFFYLANISINF